MNNIAENNNPTSEIKVTPVASSTYSLAALGTRAPVLFSVRISGIQTGGTHSLNFNVYGLSKSGFFIERTSGICSEYVTDINNPDTFIFDFSHFSCNIKKEFFTSLRSETPGKIYVEVIIDGKKIMGDTQIILLPANVFPVNSAPSVFASVLKPCDSAVVRITSSLFPDKKSTEALYDALKKQKIIYSVRDSDFLSHNVRFEYPDAIFSSGSRMASPLEMAVLFCSCALRLELQPVFVVVKTSKGPRILCGTTKKTGLFGISTGNTKKLLELCLSGAVSLFEITSLFTGHNVELSDAEVFTRNLLTETDIYYALDICAAIKNGTVNVITPEDFDFFSSLKVSDRKPSVLTLPQCAESLLNTENNSLIDFSFKDNGGFPVSFSEFASVNLFAISLNHSGFQVHSTSEKIDLMRFSANPEGICSIYLADSFVKEDLTLTEKQDTAIEKELYAEKVYDNEKLGYISTPLSNVALIQAIDDLNAAVRTDKELYLACGFLKFDGKYAPLAFLPVRVFYDGKNIATIEFLSSKPRLNRLLCETLKTCSYGSSFFERYGLPSENLSDIESCFHLLCEKSAGKYEIIYEYAVSAFSLKNAAISFAIADRAEKIFADSLSRELLGKTGESIREFSFSHQRVRELEQKEVDFFDSDVLKIVSYALDGDLFVKNINASGMYDVISEISCENLSHGHSTLVLSDSDVGRSDIVSGFAGLGIADAVLELSDNVDIKKQILDKIVATSKSDYSDVAEVYDPVYAGIAENLDRYSRSKTEKYDFGFSFYDACTDFVRAGELLTPEEKNTFLESEKIFFPDLSSDSTKKIFEASHALCSASSKLALTVPYSQYSLSYANLVSDHINVQGVFYTADKALVEIIELSDAVKEIFTCTGFDHNDIKTLPALHSFLSLLVLISKDYDQTMTQRIFETDIYQISKTVSQLRDLASQLGSIENELCEFDKAIFDLDSDKLFDDSSSQDSVSKAEIAKLINSYRTADIPPETKKKSVSEVLQYLYTYSDLESEFKDKSSEMNDIFGVSWKGISTDWARISKKIDFAKMSDVLLKKVYGTDQHLRHKATENFRNAYDFCKDRINSTRIIAAAGTFDRIFSDSGSLVNLAETLCVNFYSLTFADGIFSDNGLYGLVSEWRDNVSFLPAVSEYNRACQMCESVGLSVFVSYLSENQFTCNTEKIFTRSILFPAIKQIALRDNDFIRSSSENKIDEFARLHKERIESNRAILKNRHLGDSSQYITSNRSKMSVFIELLHDNTYTGEDIVLRFGETIRSLFPVVVSDSLHAFMLSDFDNLCIVDSDMIETPKVIPALSNGRHRLVLSGPYHKDKNCFASDCDKTGIAKLSLIDARSDLTLSDFCHKNFCVSHVYSQLSSYDRRKYINVLEAQTVALEVMNYFDRSPDSVVDILTFTDRQKYVMNDVVSAISEKSDAVARAVKDKRLSVGCITERRPRKCDAAFVSVVYGKEETAGMAVSYDTLDDTNNFIAGIPAEIISSVCGAAKKLIVVSSFNPAASPDKVGSHGLESLFAFSSFAAANASVHYSDVRTKYYTYAKAFADILSENDIPVYLSERDNVAFYLFKNKMHAAVFEDVFSVPAFSRECADYEKITDSVAVRFDGADTVLNPVKILDKIKNMEESL